VITATSACRQLQRIAANPGRDRRRRRTQGTIRTALLAKAGADQVLMPESLLDEVTALVEWPAVYECHFEEEFLAVPQECLILTMQTNQKYFALTDAQGKLRSRFLIVSNIETDDPKHIVGGNERVVRPRLSDAKFFFEQDKKKSLESRLPLLANVVYHNKLGNQAERMERVTRLAGAIARRLGYDVLLAERGAHAGQGRPADRHGRRVPRAARHHGHLLRAPRRRSTSEVALAISEHYQPRFAGDALPSTKAPALAVALADKLETLVGIWGIGLQPTGDKDPFALRRHALGVLRMLVEKRLPLALSELLGDAAACSKPQASRTRSPKSPPSCSTACAACCATAASRRTKSKRCWPEPDRVDDVVQRLEACRPSPRCRKASRWPPPTSASRTSSRRPTRRWHGDVMPPAAGRRREGAVRRVQRVKPQVDSAFARGDFTGTLKTLAQLRDDVDAFFNDVMVMAEDEALRNNRLALLSHPAHA
jgi:glycyl-tRNA synthetase beta chain